MSRGRILLGTLLALALFFPGAECASFQGAKTNKKSTTSTTSLRNTPKCVFLREERNRLDKEAQEYATNSPFGGVQQISEVDPGAEAFPHFVEFAATREEQAAQRSLVDMKVRACDAGLALSSKDQLPRVEDLRERHIKGAKRRWVQMGGTEEDLRFAPVMQRVHAVYDQEGQSFFNRATDGTALDADVLKDYPNLMGLIQSSSLPHEHKTFLAQNGRYIRYEEAGRLANILNGTDPERSVGYAYSLRKSVEERLQEATSAEQQRELQAKSSRKENSQMDWQKILLFGSLGLLLLAGLWVYIDKKRAYIRAVRDGDLRAKFWFGWRELISWEPGETVVLLENKKLVQMSDPSGGMKEISVLRGQEYKGRLSYKPKLYTWTTDPVFTNDGLEVRLTLGMLWVITNPNSYITSIAEDYHIEDYHEGPQREYTDDPRGEKVFDRKLTKTTEVWIRNITGGILREYIGQMPMARLIAASVPTYMSRYYLGGEGAQDSREDGTKNPSWLTSEAFESLKGKFQRFGIEIQEFHAREFHLPQAIKSKLESVRAAFYEPTGVEATSEARAIDERKREKVRTDTLRDLVSVIGKDATALTEVLKAFGLAKIPVVISPTSPISVAQQIMTKVTNMADQSMGGEEDLPVLPITPEGPTPNESGADAKPDEGEDNEKAKGASA